MTRKRLILVVSLFIVALSSSLCIAGLSCQYDVEHLETENMNASLQDAYDDQAVQSDDTLLVTASDLYEDVTFDRDIAIKIDGGYDCDFSSKVGESTVHGKIVIENGTLEFVGMAFVERQVLAISPSSRVLYVNETFTFSTTGGAPPFSFSVVSGSGSINSTTGEYTAPASPDTAVVRVTDSIGGTSDANVTIYSGVALSLSPSSKILYVNDTFTFSASNGTTPYTYSVVSGGGSINSTTGEYTAPASPDTAVVRVTDALGAIREANVEIYDDLAIVPSSKGLYVNEIFTFGASGGAPPLTYSVVSGGGSINSTTGEYTAPASPDTAVVRVTDSIGGTSDASLAIYNDLVLSPSSKTLYVNESFTFSASGGAPPLTYSVVSGGGTINSISGEYTAPSSSDSAIVRVTDALGSYDEAAVTVQYSGTMKVYGLNDYLDSYYIYWPPHENDVSSVTVDYRPNISSTLQAGEEDRFYVSGVFINSSNYLSEGTYVATNTDNSSQVDVQISSLEPGKQYYLFAVRYITATGEPKSPPIYSNYNLPTIVETRSNEIDVTDAEAQLVFDPATDDFLDWFHVLWDSPYVRAKRMTDGSMGDFIRIDQWKYDSIFYVMHLIGKKKVSPRYDWSLEFTMRHSGAGTGGTGGSDFQQALVGFNSGTQNKFWWEFWRTHPSNLDDGYIYDNGPGFWPDTWDDHSWVSKVSSGNEYGGYHSTGTIWDEDQMAWLMPLSDWRLKPSSLHSDRENWRIAAGSVAKVRFDYNATDKSVKHYVNDVLVSTWYGTLANDQGLAIRRRYPANHYPLPIVPTIRAQHVKPADNNHIDIGEIKLTTSCPNAYAGWTVNNGSDYDYWGAVGDFGFYWMDPDSTDWDDLGFWYAGETAGNRYTTNKWNGFTIMPTELGGDPTVYIYTGDTYSYGGATTQYVFSQPITVPAGKTAVKVAFQGVPGSYGTLKGRLYDGDKTTPLTDWVDITSVYDQQLTDVATNSSTEVVARFEIDFNGGTPANYESPPRIVGFEVEFADEN